MDAVQLCPECGAVLAGEQTCLDYFHQMLFWENENPAYGEVHHLTVLCYHIQHPSLYSPEGLSEAMRLLSGFLEQDLTPQQARTQNRARVDSGKRRWKIKGNLAAHGSYEKPVRWGMTAQDVMMGGADHYCEQVRRWARSIYQALDSLAG